MLKQKLKAAFFTAIPFGIAASLTECFFGDNPVGFLKYMPFLLCVFAFGLAFSKLNKKTAVFMLKFKSLAAGLFTAAFILSYLPQSLLFVHFFVIFVLAGICASFVADIKCPCLYLWSGAGLVAGTALGMTTSPCNIYPMLVLLALFYGPTQSKKSIQDIWNDIAIPLFVFVLSFGFFILTNYSGSFSQAVAEAAVMLMIGVFLISNVNASALRLTLMTIVLMIFGSYVYSIHNASSIFSAHPRIVEISSEIKNI